jgi:tRNA pseudouridine55 synthase
MPERVSGRLLLNKPCGPTSFDCVRKTRTILSERRIGHCGTLDPMAEGVLILLFGTETRRQREFLDMQKQYWFRSEFGRFTDSGDRTGTTIEEKSFGHVTYESLVAVAGSFIGQQWQTPPKISAIKYQGKRLYEWARKGVDVPRPPRQVIIDTFEILNFDGRFYEARVTCSSGTYIRSLAEDVARRLETAATVDALVRERVGSYRREDGVSWDTLCQSSREQLLQLAHV